ncbi:unnamed protein product [Nezara viridula]|uniref:Uncharacterized protein n=1 Tax=Nezara viridula TaxID=85310 RepID=A0A9P0HHN4_NEZVI|nr:unnamed protein product [Nezara viridula]
MMKQGAEEDRLLPATLTIYHELTAGARWKDQELIGQQEEARAIKEVQDTRPRSAHSKASVATPAAVQVAPLCPQSSWVGYNNVSSPLRPEVYSLFPKYKTPRVPKPGIGLHHSLSDLDSPHTVPPTRNHPPALTQWLLSSSYPSLLTTEMSLQSLLVLLFDLENLFSENFWEETGNDVEL